MRSRIMATTLSASPSIVSFTPQRQFHIGWERVSGIKLIGDAIQITPTQYFERFEDPSWTYVPWETVQAHWTELSETPDMAIEQACLQFIRKHSQQSRDASVILENAEKVYSFVFNESLLHEIEDLDHVTANDLRVLRESSILCALNKVALNGRITNIGPAWYFAQCARLVYGLSATDEQRVDELFHGGFFNALRLREQTRAHVALGGRLVHGCQSSGNGSGGCVVGYGTDVAVMQKELLALRPGFLNQFSEATGGD
jgi:hypothetical protein